MYVCILYKYTYIGLRSNLAECETFLELKFLEIIPSLETNLDDSIDSSNFSVGSNVPLILKDSITH